MGRITRCLVGLGLAAVGACGRPAVRLVSLTIDPLTPVHREFLGSFERGLAELAERSAAADTLWQFYRAHAIPAQRINDRLLVPVRVGRDQDFYITPALEDTVDLADSTFVFGKYSFEADLLVLRYIELTPLLKGLFFSHEIVHAYRDKIRGIPQYPALSPAWIREEVIAHVGGTRILNELTAGGWARLVVNGLEQRLTAIRDRGQSAEAAFDRYSREEEQAIASWFGPLPVRDQNLLLVHYQHDLQIHRRYRETPTEDEAHQRILDYFLGFYTKHLAH